MRLKLNYSLLCGIDETWQWQIFGGDFQTEMIDEGLVRIRDIESQPNIKFLSLKASDGYKSK